MGKERKLWCDGDNSVTIKNRVVRLINSFNKYGKLVKYNNFNYGRETFNRTYALTLEDVGDVKMTILPSCVRIDEEGGDLLQDIAVIGFIFSQEGDRFMFTIPWEWADTYAHNDDDDAGPCYSLEELYNEVIGFLEDYL